MMALFTSVQSGDFDVASTWDVGSGFPGASDTFAIVSTHTVTIPVGLSANTTGTISGSTDPNRAVLIINGSLQLTANMVSSLFNRLQMGPGATLDLNGFNYFTTDNSSSTQYNFIVVEGTALSRAKIISSVAGTGNISDNGGVKTIGEIDIEYCDFTDCGQIKLDAAFNSGLNFNMRHCTFVGCDMPDLGGTFHMDNDFTFENVDVRDSVTTISNRVMTLTVDPRIGVGSGGITTVGGITGKSSVAGLFFRTSGPVGGWGQIVLDDLIFNPLGSSAEELNNYFGREIGSLIDFVNDVYLFTPSDNPHTIVRTANRFSGIIEATYAEGHTDNGDHFFLQYADDCGVDNALILEGESGALLNAIQQNYTGNYYASNNTLVGNYTLYGALFIRENGGTLISPSTLNMYDNIIYNRVPFAGSNGMRADGPADQITAMDYNAWFDIDNPYDGATSATKTPGVTDDYGGRDLIDIDPQFVDDTRSLATWALQETGTGTDQAGIDHLLGINGYDAATKSQIAANESGAVISELTAWVRAGYAPTNPAYDGAGSTGTYIGAIEPVISGGQEILTTLPYSIGVNGGIPMFTITSDETISTVESADFFSSAGYASLLSTGNVVIIKANNATKLYTVVVDKTSRSVTLSTGLTIA